MLKNNDTYIKYSIIIFLLALSLRLCYTFIPELDYFNSKNPVKFLADEQDSDSGNYVKLANGFMHLGYPSLDNKNIIMNGGYLYPLLIFLNLLLTDNLIIIILLQCVLDSLVCVILFFISLQITGKVKKIALLSAVLYAIYYPNFNYSARILTESIYTFLIVLGIFWIFKNRNEFQIKDYMIIGLIFSLAALTRSMILFVFIISIISIIVYKIFYKRKINCKIIFAIIAFFIIQIPWIFIGYQNTGKIILGSTGGGIAIASGTFLPALGDQNPVYYKMFSDNPINVIEKQAIEKKWDTAQKDSAYKSIALEQIKNNLVNYPLETIKVALYQLSRFWFNIPFYNPPSKGTLFITFINILLLTFAFSTFILHRKNEKVMLILFAFLLYQMLHSITFSLIRYSAPLMPIVVLFAAEGIYMMFKFLKHSINNLFIKP